MTALAVLFCLASAARSAAGPLDPEGYRVERLSYGAGQPVAVRFILREPACVTVTAHDADHAAVAVVVRSEQRPAGEVTIAWNGRTDSGAPVPGGVYYFVVEAAGSSGYARDDPALASGGEPRDLGFGESSYDRGRREIVFQLERPSWVLARAGIHEGPLLATPIDWQPFAAGEHRVPWSGKDDSGLVDFSGHPRFSLVLRGMALPRGAVAIEGAAARAKTARPAAKALDHRLDVCKAATARGVDPRYLQLVSHRTAPSFTVTGVAAKAASSPAGPTLGFKVSADESTVARLVEQRFEIVTYVDFRRVAEEESGYLPYTVELPTSTLPEGEHTVSVSVVTFSDQSTTRSLKVQVDHR